MRPIYTFGDSHANFGWQSIPNVKITTFGPRTMHTFGKERQNFAAEVPPGSIVVFCFGEVDCRCHVKKHQPWHETIDRLVEDYLQAVAVNAAVDKETWIFNVPPPPRKKGAIEFSQFPFEGTDEERLAYANYMNDRLRAGPFPFIDVYSRYADEQGFLRMDLSDGHVHITDDRFLREWLESHGR
jgi:hypothetical protein